MQMKKWMYTLLTLLAFINLSAQILTPKPGEALVKLSVADNKGVAQAAQSVTLVSLKDKKTYALTTDATGKAQLLLPSGQKFKVKYKAFNEVESDLVLDLPASQEAYVLTYKITITPPRSFTLDNVFFDTGKATLRQESYKELNELAEYMNLKNTLVIEIAGHTDNVGNAESNLALSENRAMAVRDYLLKKGIKPERIQAKGYGDTQPVSDNTTTEGRQKNRRTEVVILQE